MTIICGTFSNAAREAAEVAAALSQRFQEPLLLVHAIDEGSGDVSDGPVKAEFAHSTVELMSDTAEALRERGVRVSECVEIGAPEDVLSDAATRTHARLIVIGEKRPSSALPLLGGTTEKTVRKSSVPVMTVREAAPFQEWIAGVRPLRVIVATDLSATSQAASAIARTCMR